MLDPLAKTWSRHLVHEHLHHLAQPRVQIFGHGDLVDV